MGWNDLSSAQQGNWKAKNYNMGIRVSEQSIQKLRAGKTFENNIAAARRNGLSAESREAMNRFYGKARVSSALGNSLGKTSTGKGKPPTAQHHTGGNTPPKTNPTTVKPKPAPKPRSSSQSFLNGSGNFIKNELLGVDDFSKLRGEMKQHRWGAMAKSFGAGVLELGTTTAAVVAAIPSGGTSLAATVGAKSAMVAGRQVVKQSIKSGAKKVISGSAVKSVAKSTGKAVVGGSFKQGARNAAKVGIAVVRPGKTAGKALKSFSAATTRQALKNAGISAERQAARAAQETVAKKAAATAAAKAAHAPVAKKLAAETAKYKAKQTAAKKAAAAASKKAGKKVAPKAVKVPVALTRAQAAAGKTGAAVKSARGSSLGAKSALNRANAASAAKISARKAAAKKAAARKTMVRRGARRGQYAHITVAANSRKSNNK